MYWRELLAWGSAIFLLSGIETAYGNGFPGPLFVLTIAAALTISSTPLASIIGATSIFVSTALCDGSIFIFLILCTPLFYLCRLLTKFFSSRNMLVAIGTTALFSFILAFFMSVNADTSIWSAFCAASIRTSINTLWVIPIYGIVLVSSSRKDTLV